MGWWYRWFAASTAITLLSGSLWWTDDSFHLGVVGFLYGSEALLVQLAALAPVFGWFALHVLAGSAWALLCLLQLNPRVRARWPALHRWCGRAAMLLAAASMAGLFAIRRSLFSQAETVAAWFFGALFLASAAMAWARARQGDWASHREWALRMTWVGLGVGAIRVVLVAWVVAGMDEGCTLADRRERFGAIFWLAMSLSALAGEAHVQSTRAAPRRD